MSDERILQQPYILNHKNTETEKDHRLDQWRTEGGVWGVQTPQKLRNFDKADPNSQFCGKYIRKNLIIIRVSLICKLSGTPD
jgi:hypothetical protein